jgi:hypothetical protein
MTRAATCTCSAYRFPHRLNGGKCNVHSFAAWYLEHKGNACFECKHKTSEYGRAYCPVAEGDRIDCLAFDTAEYEGRVK